MTKMNRYNDADRDYLRKYNYKRKYFDADFFANWVTDKSDYY